MARQEEKLSYEAHQRRQKRIKRLSNTLLLIAFTLFGLKISNRLGLMNYIATPLNSSNVKRKTEEKLPQLMSEIEKKFNFSPYSPPKLEYELSDYWTGSMREVVDGSYNHKTDTLTLNSGSLTTGNSLSDICIEVLTLGKNSDLDPVLTHELAHFYTDKLGEETIKNWCLIDEKTNLELISYKLIIEGIAVNISAEIMGTHKTAELTEFAPLIKKVAEVDSFDLTLDIVEAVCYQGGYLVVNPIISKYGKNGISYLLKNYPSKTDLMDIEGYQKRILQELSEIY